MKKLFSYFLLIMAALCLALPLFSQQIQYTTSVPHTAGTPSGAPSAQGSWLRYDKTNKVLYQWSGAAWIGITGVVADGDKGDVTVSSSGANWQIDANSIGSAEISSGAVNTSELADEAVTDAKIGIDAVTQVHIRASSVGSSELVAGGVGNSALASNAVDSSKVANRSLSPADLGQSGASTGQVLKWTGTNGWRPANESGGGGAGYLVYTALLSQSGTSAPTATVLENTLSGTVVWTYNDVGSYVGTLTGAFTSGKTYCTTNLQYVQDAYLSYLTRGSDNTVVFGSYDLSGNPANLAEPNIVAIEIRVYP